MNRHPLLTRRRLLASAIAPAMSLSLPAMADAQGGGLIASARQFLGQRPRQLFIGVLDVSASPSQLDASEVHLRALQAFFRQAQAGDELLSTTVGDAGIDRTQMNTASLRATGKSFQDKKVVREGIEGMDVWLRNQPKGKGQSRFLETLAALQAPLMKVVDAGLPVDVLVAGDGVENSPLANFERGFDGKKLVSNLASKNMLITARRTPAPSASAARVRLMFVGVGGLSDAAFTRCRDFWSLYAQESQIDLAYYGRDLPPFFGA